MDDERRQPQRLEPRDRRATASTSIFLNTLIDESQERPRQGTAPRYVDYLYSPRRYEPCHERFRREARSDFDR